MIMTVCWNSLLFREVVRLGTNFFFFHYKKINTKKKFTFEISHFACSFTIMRHRSFIARTVFVNNNDVEAACRVLNRILGKEDILDQYRRTRYYEKPFEVSWNTKDMNQIIRLWCEVICSVSISKLFIIESWEGPIH